MDDPTVGYVQNIIRNDRINPSGYGRVDCSQIYSSFYRIFSFSVFLLVGFIALTLRVTVGFLAPK